MTDTEKSLELDSVKEHLQNTKQNINEKIDQLRDFIDKLYKSLTTWNRGSDDVDMIHRGIDKAHEEITSMQDMQASPYFFKVDMHFDDEAQTKPVYISKFSLPEHRIYSWVSPIARLRFSNVGRSKYKLPSGNMRAGTIFRKDYYTIRQGELLKASIETKDTAKFTLFEKSWQEKKQFGLTEIIEKLDALQDDVLRIDPKGSLLISGAAGSGKTTLALHKIAFLVQSPLTASLYRSNKITVFVQDNSTKEYFAAILPNLSLSQVQITTFKDWAFSQLNLKGYEYSDQPHIDDYPLLIHKKKLALSSKHRIMHSTNIYEQLDSIYFDFLDSDSYLIYKQQKSAKILDRFDLTLLLKDKLDREDIKDLQNLVLVDEAENYLPEQLKLFKRLLAPMTRSIIFIGDLVQQSFPFTIKSWDEIGETFENDRKVCLPQVYRNTAQIRNFLVSKGYSQKTDTTLRNGNDVSESNFDNMEMCNAYISDSIKNAQGIIGVISNDNKLLQQLPKLPGVLYYSIFEAQGVEFDTVFLINKIHDYSNKNWPLDLIDELHKVDRDQFLVGVTRTKEKLHVLNLQD